MPETVKPLTKALPTLPCSGCGARVEISTMRYSMNSSESSQPSEPSRLVCRKCFRNEPK